MSLNRFAHFVRYLFSAALAAAMMLVPAQGQLTTLYTFETTPNNPNNTAVTQGRDGEYYFTTCSGMNPTSALFKMTTSGTLTQVYTPPGNCVVGVTQGTDGNFYLALNDYSCCNNTNGAIYKVTPKGTATLLYTFTGGADGSEPYAPPIQGTNGTLYGTTTSRHVNFDTAYLDHPERNSGHAAHICHHRGAEHLCAPDARLGWEFLWEQQYRRRQQSGIDFQDDFNWDRDRVA